MRLKIVYSIGLVCLFCDLFSAPLKVNFDASMGKDRYSYNRYMKNEGNLWDMASRPKSAHSLYNFFKRLYNKNSSLPTAETFRVPPVTHMIWLGGRFPEKFKAFKESWKRCHPSWTHILWVDNPQNYQEGRLINSFDELVKGLDEGLFQGESLVVDVKSVPLCNRHLFEQETNLGAKSDIFRYEIVYLLGGVYLDTDFECLKPSALESLNKTYGFYVGIQPLSVNVVALGIALFGAEKGHPVLKGCLDDLPKMYKSSANVIERTGPLFFTKVFWKVTSSYDNGVIALPATFFYPVPMGNFNKSHLNRFLSPESVAVHWWAASWQK
jgi:mannosyltransferase OCH1-like enzyme